MSIIAIRHDDDRGGMQYPLLVELNDWMIRTSPLTEVTDDTEGITLRWVKDDKVSDLFIPGTNTEEFITLAGLCLSMKKGAFVLSKRLSRIMRPYRYWNFFQPHEIQIDFSAELDEATWDGIGLMHSRMIDLLLENLADHPDRELHVKDLKAARRFEITILNADGQSKGHVLVVDDLASDFLFPAGSAKKEIALGGRVFIGVDPVHSQDDMRLDVQSIINHYPFFTPEQLLAWMEEESDLFLETIQTDGFEAVLGNLHRLRTIWHLEQLSKWWLGEYLASGGKLMWFAGTIKAMANQHLQRLNRLQDNFRCPVPGGRYYIFPAVVGERDVQPGEIEIDPESATAWVATRDWNDFIVSVLGGCDGDDALWIFPFTDHDREKKILAWRSPNQLGEYVILKPTAKSHTITWKLAGGAEISYPEMDSRLLAPRIDTVSYSYGELEKFPKAEHGEYSIAAMETAINAARINAGALGAYCNMMMLLKALYGRLPENLPARLEDVIDGTVKDARDMSPVMAWIGMVASQIVQQCKSVPYKLVPRIERGLSEREKKRLKVSTDHWIDYLIAGIRQHIETYSQAVEDLTRKAEPPIQLFIVGRNWRSTELQQIYARALHARGKNYEQAQLESVRYLEQNKPFETEMLLGTACSIYSQSNYSDSVLWQEEIAPRFIQALRQAGVIGTPIWTRYGAVLYYEEHPMQATSITLKGVWFNWLKLQDPIYACMEMSEVPAAVRENAKTRIAQAALSFIGMRITMREKGERVLAYSERGNLIGFVQRGQEENVGQHRTWQIVHSRSEDGNLHTVLMPG